MEPTSEPLISVCGRCSRTAWGRLEELRTYRRFGALVSALHKVEGTITSLHVDQALATVREENSRMPTSAAH